MSKPTHKLRPLLPADIGALREVFAQSIDELTAEDYDEDQRAAWISAAEDAEAFAARLKAAVTLVVETGGEYQGFASLKDNTVLDMLYVHPFAAGQGVGTTLVDALERLAAARGATAITVEASDTAQPFFEARGYFAMQRNSRAIGDIWLSNTTMKKPLVPSTPKAAA